MVLGVAAGCSESLEQTGSTAPEYGPEDDELPQLTADYLDGDGWNREPGEEAAEDLDRAYAQYGDSETWEAFVASDSTIVETVEEAQTRIEELFAGAREEEFELANEAYWSDEDMIALAAFQTLECRRSRRCCRTDRASGDSRYSGSDRHR